MSNTGDGTFITVEGIDGTGKTSVIEHLKPVIADHGRAVSTTAEPSRYWTGKQVRRALRSDTPTFTDFFLFMADRHYHIEEWIKPSLENGHVVLSDRFADSTRAYQSVQLEDEFATKPHTDSWIETVMEPWSIEPDAVLYLHAPVDVVLERVDAEEKYEKKEMLEQVKENYAKSMGIAESKGIPWKTIDATQPLDEVKIEAERAVREILNNE